MTTSPPNILFIQADQLAPAFLAAYGNTLVKTPNIDKLAEGGVVFDRAYCNSPLCAPSRASMMSGLLASEIGAYDNGAEFPCSIPTIAHYLRLLDYRTAISGKMHFIGPDYLHGFEERLTAEIYTADFRLTSDWSKDGYTTGGDFEQSGPIRRSAQIDYDEEVCFRAVGKIYDFVREGDNRPFFLTASFTHPHDPYLCTKEHWNRYRDDDIDLPKVRLTAEQMDPHSRRLHNIHGIYQTELTDAELCKILRSYYGSISYLDDKVGELLSALEDCGYSDSTVIIFTADHGDMMGERGMFYKNHYYENSLRVPLLVYAPGHFSTGRREKALVSLVDLLPTMVQIGSCGAKPDLIYPVCGKSLYGLLKGEDDGNDYIVYAEILDEPTPGPILMVRKGDYKYIWSEVDAPLLYDLRADPLEANNLAGQKQISSVERDLEAERERRWSNVSVQELKKKVMINQKQRLLVHAANNTGKAPDWEGFATPVTGRGCFRGGSYAKWSRSGILS